MLEQKGCVINFKKIHRIRMIKQILLVVVKFQRFTICTPREVWERSCFAADAARIIVVCNLIIDHPDF
jgi:hypothetical protein